MSVDPEEALRQARERLLSEEAVDVSICWSRFAGGQVVRTHILRGNGSWGVYRVADGQAVEVEQGVEG